MSKKKNYNTFESVPINKFFIIFGSLIMLCYAFFLITVDKPWISLIISILITWFSFGIAKQNQKKFWWIVLGIIAIFGDILNIIATIQLIIN